MRASEVMCIPEVTVRPWTSVKRAATLLVTHGYTALAVTDADERLVGVVAETDLLRGRISPDARALVHPDWPVAPGPEPPATVGAVMSTDLVVRSPSSDVAELANVMLERRVRMVPIVRAGQLVGVVTRGDLIRLVARDDEIVARDVRHHLGFCCCRRAWQVSVADGVVTLVAEDVDEQERHVADVVARSVPGVFTVHLACRELPRQQFLREVLADRQHQRGQPRAGVRAAQQPVQRDEETPLRLLQLRGRLGVLR
jgi:CBS domain-containing protein